MMIQLHIFLPLSLHLISAPIATDGFSSFCLGMNMYKPNVLHQQSKQLQAIETCDAQQHEQRKLSAQKKSEKYRVVVFCLKQKLREMKKTTRANVRAMRRTRFIHRKEWILPLFNFSVFCFANLFLSEHIRPASDVICNDLYDK